MRATVRKYATAGVALTGAAVIAVAPVAPPPLPSPEIPTADPTVQLAAASITNIPVNMFQAIANVPANALAGLQEMTDALNFGGSWWVYTPTNVLGFDPADPPKTKALVNTLLPFPTLSNPLGNALSVFLQANLPMHEGCTGIFEPCADPLALLRSMFRVSLFELVTGYTFPEVINPVSEAEGEVGEKIPGEVGEPVDWSEQYVKIDPFEPIKETVRYLLSEPTGVDRVTLGDVISTVSDLAAAAGTALDPFVSGSFFFKPENSGFLAPIAYVARILAPILCGCDPDLPAPATGPATGPAQSTMLVSSVPDLDPAAGETVAVATAVETVDTAPRRDAREATRDAGATATGAPETAETTLVSPADTPADKDAPERAGADAELSGGHEPSRGLIQTSSPETAGSAEISSAESAPRSGLADTARPTRDRVSPSISTATDGSTGSGPQTRRADTRDRGGRGAA